MLMKFCMMNGHRPRDLYLHEAMLLLVDAKPQRKAIEEEHKLVLALEQLGVVKRGAE